MAWRSTESPMEFEWNTGHGPIDSNSPFLQRPRVNKAHSSSNMLGQKRSFGVFDSPQKTSLPAYSHQSSVLTASRPTALAPSTPSTKSAHLQLRQSSFTTPQRSFDLDFSSGVENESSPGADNEDTPEQAPRQIVQFSSNQQLPKPALPNKLHFTPYHSSGRGEVVRRPHHDAIRRVNKKRRRDADRDVRSAVKRTYSDASDSSDLPAHHQSQSHGSPNLPRPQQMGIVPSVLSFIDAHPRLPATLSYYAQFLLNLFVVLIIIYAVSSIYLSIREDFQKASSLASAEMVAEMAACASEYSENNCKDIAARVPAMRSVCESWERCMSRDPRMVGRAKVSARTFAEILSSFVDGVSVKALGLGGALFLGFWAIGNVSLSWVRAKVEPPVGGYAQSYNGYHGPGGLSGGHLQVQRHGSGAWDGQHFGGYEGSRVGCRDQEPIVQRLEGKSPVKKLGFR